jgi:hypothetical protein
MENAVPQLQAEPTPVSETELLSELNYFRAQRMLSAMLDKGLISREEFCKITRLNRKSFIPVLSKIMPDVR